MLKSLLSPLMVLLLGLGVLGECQTATAQQPPVKAPVPVPADSITVNTTTSFIDLNSVGADYNVTVKVDYVASAPRGIIIGVYNENTSAWDGLFAGPVATGNGTITSTFKIKKNSAWGLSIANGTFDQAWVNADMSSVGPFPQTWADANWIWAR